MLEASVLALDRFLRAAASCLAARLIPFSVSGFGIFSFFSGASGWTNGMTVQRLTAQQCSKRAKAKFKFDLDGIFSMGPFYTVWNRPNTTPYA